MVVAEDYGVNLVRGTPEGDLHAERHMMLCTSVNMIGLAIVLNGMVESGHVSPRQAEAFKAQAEGLLATMLAENSRSFIGSAQQSTASKVRRYGADRW